MPIWAVSFDLFDTLVDLHFDRLPAFEHGGRAVPSTLGAQHALLAERGHDVELESYAKALADSDRELAESHGKHGLEVPTRLRFERLCDRLGLTDPELPEALTQRHMARIASVAEMPAHHARILEELAARFRLGLCSNFSHAETALAILARCGLRPHLSAVAISETAGYRKPRSEIFAAVLGELGIEAAETVHVGDHLTNDVAGASAVGMRTVWLTRRVRDPARALCEHTGPHPTWIVKDLRELPALLERT